MTDQTIDQANQPANAPTDTHKLIRAVARLYMETPIEVLDRFEQLYPEDAKVLGDLIIN